MSLACDDGLARYRCLHFALHGHSIDSDTPMEAHLLLREKKLDGLDISNWRLDADLVVLSACCFRPAANVPARGPRGASRR